MTDNRQPQSLSPTAHAEARSRAYALCGEVLRHGPTAATWPLLDAVPELATPLAAYAAEDAAAAAHYQALQRDLSPHASHFLDPEAQLGTAVTDAVHHAYGDAGWKPSSTSESPDHLGVMLAFLSFLAGATADAYADHRLDRIPDLDAHTLSFLDAHLLPWLPPLHVALQHQDDPFYRALGGRVTDLVLDHRAHLSPAPCAAPTLPSAGPDLDDAKTGLKDIAAFLAVPVRCGGYLGHADLARLGRKEHLPRGFGSRVQTLTTLFRSAATYDSTAPLLADFNALATAWSNAYASLGTAWPFLKPITDAWAARATTTLALLARLDDEVHRLNES